jgi:hypothetical protein
MSTVERDKTVGLVMELLSKLFDGRATEKVAVR